MRRAGRAVRLAPGDIESIQIRLGRAKLLYTPVYARLRPGAAGRLQVTDGWYQLYWTLGYVAPLPHNLIVALAVFAPGRLAGSLERTATGVLTSKPPVNHGYQRPSPPQPFVGD